MMKILEIVRRFWKYLFAKLRKCSQLLYLEEIGPWPLFHEKYELQHWVEDDGDVWTEGSESESDADTHIKSSGTWRTTAASVEGVQTENSLKSANYSSDSSVNLNTQWCEHEYAALSSMYSSTVHEYSSSAWRRSSPWMLWLSKMRKRWGIALVSSMKKELPPLPSLLWNLHFHGYFLRFLPFGWSFSLAVSVHSHIIRQGDDTRPHPSWQRCSEEFIHPWLRNHDLTFMRKCLEETMKCEEVPSPSSLQVPYLLSSSSSIVKVSMELSLIHISEPTRPY